MASPAKKRTPRCATLAREIAALEKRLSKLRERHAEAVAAETARANARQAKLDAKHERQQAKLRAQQERERKRSGVAARCTPEATRKPGKKGKEAKGDTADKVRRFEAEELKRSWPDGQVVKVSELKLGEAIATTTWGVVDIAGADAKGFNVQLRFVPRAGELKGREVGRDVPKASYFLRLPPKRRGRDNGTIPLFPRAS